MRAQPSRTEPRMWPLRRSRYGYVVGVPVMVAHGPVFASAIGCPPPIIDGRLVVTGRWATACFMPAFQRAKLRWGRNVAAISSEIMLELVPSTRLGPARTAAEQELRRRIDLAVAVLLNADGVIVPYPTTPPLPRPTTNTRQPPWLRVLLTGWP